MKDPAVLFYTQDFITGTILMSDEQRGKYIMLLCLQHQNGKLTERDMLKICREKDEDIWGKFYQEEGYFYNKRMLLESEKRSKFCNHQRENIKKRWDKKAYHGNTTVIPLENENENENEDINENNNINVQFENFRKSYPGTKRGYQIEFENFKSKYKNWKEIIPILFDKLQYQIETRNKKSAVGGFVPEWKNLKTWLNQKCWEEEISNEIISKIPTTISYEEYLELVHKHGPEAGKKYKAIKREGERKAVFELIR